jgi:hypothetical protein
MIQTHTSWTIHILLSIKVGNYVLHHETIVLYQAESVDGAWNHP